MKFRNQRERGATQRTYLQVNASPIMKFAREQYARQGRGAVVIHLHDTNPAADNLLQYLSQTAVARTGVGWPDTWAEDVVQAYDPAAEVVIAMIYDDGTMSVLHTRFLDRAAARN